MSDWSQIDDLIPEGTKKWFEYHCLESPKSSDAELWYRSHQKVTVLRIGGCDPVPDGGKTKEERAYNGIPLVYLIQFEDGCEGSAFEDELLDSESEYCRPAPPVKDVA